MLYQDIFVGDLFGVIDEYCVELLMYQFVGQSVVYCCEVMMVEEVMQCFMGEFVQVSVVLLQFYVQCDVVLCFLFVGVDCVFEFGCFGIVEW